MEPQQLTYTVTYFSEASEFNPYPTENQRTFHEYCKDAGWSLVAEWAQMQIFCSEREDPTPIETDESVKLKAIHRAMKKNFLPSNVVLLLLSVVQFYLQLHIIAEDPILQLSLGSSLFLAATWSVLGIQILFILMGYIIWYRKSRKAVNRGMACAESGSGYKKAVCLCSGMILTLLVLAISPLCASNQLCFWGVLLELANITVIIALVLVIKNALKRAQVSRKVNLTVTMFSCVILSIVLTAITTGCIVGGVHAGWFGKRSAETYTTTQPNGSTYTWDIYHDALPLTVENLQDVEYDHYSYQWTAHESFFLAQYVARQYSFPGGKLAPELNYSIVDVKLPCLFDLCLSKCLNRYDYDREEPEEDRLVFRHTDAIAWRADAAYQLYSHNEATNKYLLCWGNRIVSIRFDAIPTAEQIDVAVEKLSQSKTFA